MQYGFVLGSRSGTYRVKREHATVWPSDPKVSTTEFEIRDGRMVKPFTRSEQQFGTYELILPSLVRVLFEFTAENQENEDSKRILGDTQAEVSLALDSMNQMQFYRLFPDAMREPRRPMNSRLLAEDGRNLASVLREMVKLDSPYLEEIKTSLAQVVPGLNELRVDQSGGYLVVKLRHAFSDNGRPGSWFDLSQESDGTARLLGLLTAFYQDEPNSLIGVEEPELAIHPGALAVFAGVMIEASNRTQVIATTHSPDLIDRLPIESLRAVEMREGCTMVGPVSLRQSKAVTNGLFTSGELHSMEGLVPLS